MNSWNSVHSQATSHLLVNHVSFKSCLINPPLNPIFLWARPQLLPNCVSSPCSCVDPILSLYPSWCNFCSFTLLSNSQCMFYSLTQHLNFFFLVLFCFGFFCESVVSRCSCPGEASWTLSGRRQHNASPFRLCSFTQATRRSIWSLKSGRFFLTLPLQIVQVDQTVIWNTSLMEGNKGAIQ